LQRRRKQATLNAHKLITTKHARDIEAQRYKVHWRGGFGISNRSLGRI